MNPLKRKPENANESNVKNFWKIRRGPLRQNLT